MLKRINVVGLSDYFYIAHMNKEIRYKGIDIKSYKEEGGRLTIEGYGAFFGNVDSYGDVIDKGAFTRTIMEQGDRIAFCFQHDIYNAIGKIVDIKEDDNGLWLKVELSEAEKDIATKIREGIYKEMSIGYRVVNGKNETRDGQNVYVLSEIKLYEVSLVTIAANPLAVITSMKGAEKRNLLVEQLDSLIENTKNKKLEYKLMEIRALALSASAEDEEQEPQAKKDELSIDEVKKILLG